MKKINFFILTMLLALLSGALNAQTDLTATYLSNAGFEDDPSFTDNATQVGTALATNSEHVIFAISGWTQDPTYENYERSLVVPYGMTAAASGATNFASPANGSSVTTGNNYVLAIKSHWQPSSANTVEQTVTLPVGLYTLKYDAYVTGTVANATYLCGVSYDGTDYYSAPAAINTWYNKSYSFELTTATAVTFRFGYTKSENSGGGSSPILFIDNVQLLSGVDKTDLLAVIATATALYGDGSGAYAATLNSVITAAQNVANNANATITLVNNAIAALELAMYNYLIENASPSAPSDITSYKILNPNFDSEKTSWSYRTNDFSYGNGAIELYHKVGTFYQVLQDLPAGKYKLSLQGFCRNDGDDLAFLYAGTDTVKLSPRTGTENTMADADVSFLAGLYPNELEFTALGGNLEIGVSVQGTTNWTIFDVFKLEYLGIDLTALETALTNLVTTATAITGKMAADVATELTAAIAEANAALATPSANALTAAATRLTPAITAANSSVAAYAGLLADITAATALVATYDGVDKTTVNAAITTAQGIYDAGTADVTTVTDARSTLALAVLTFQLSGASENNPVDVTSKIENPSFEANQSDRQATIPGWTKEGSTSSEFCARNDTGHGLGDFMNGNIYFQFWSGSALPNHSLTQNITGLPNGKYRLTAAGLAPNNNGGSVFFANANTVAIGTVAGDYSVETLVTNGTLSIGVRATSTTVTWERADNFRLYYLGAVDIDQLKAALTAQIESANSLCVGKPMNAAVATALNTAITDANTAIAGSNAQDVIDALAALQSAQSTATTSIAAYTALPTPLEKYETTILPHYTGFTGYATYEALIADVKTKYNTGVYLDSEIAAAVTSLKTGEITCLLSDATDESALIINPSFESDLNAETDWTNTNSFSRANNGNFPLATGTYFMEKWVASGALPDASISQTLTEIPNGTYILKANCHSITQSNATVPTTGTYLFANAEKTQVGTNDAYTVWNVFVTDSTLTVGFKTEGTTANWVCVDDFTLYYLGLDLTAIKAQIEAEIVRAQALTKCETALASELTGAITQAQSAVNAGTLVEGDLFAAYDRITAAIAAAEPSATAYANLKAAIDAANAGKSAYSAYAGYAAYETVIGTANTAYEAGSLDNAGVTATITALADAEIACRLTQAMPFDATFAIKNPSFEGTTTYIAAGPNGGAVYSPTSWSFTYEMAGWIDVTVISTTSDNPVDGAKAFNAWAGTVTAANLYQAVTLPEGTYSLTASMRTQHANQISDQHIYAVIGTDTIKSATLTYAETASGDDDTWKALTSWQPVSVIFSVPAGGAQVTLGAASNGGENSLGWFQLDNFQLSALGNFSAEVAALQVLIDTATVRVNTAMYAADKTELQAALAQAQEAAAAPTAATLAAASTRLQAAIDAAIANINAYEDLKAAIKEAQAVRNAHQSYPGYTDFQAAISAATTKVNNHSLTTAEIATEIAALAAATQTFLDSGSGIVSPQNQLFTVVAVKNGVRINNTANNTLRIYNAQGQVVKTVKGAAESKFVALSSGVYIVNGAKVIVK
jgi:hypothetical protein